MSHTLELGSGRGPKDAKIMFVGEAYGVNEDREKTPFIGAAGDVLTELALGAGINPNKCYFTNLVNLRPPSNDLGAWHDDSGQPNEILQAGLAALQREIEEIRPNLIVPLGNYPLHYLTDKAKWNKRDHGYTGIGDYRGSILEGTSLARGIKCVPTYHPAALIYDYTKRHIVRLDFFRAAQQQAYAEVRRPRKGRIFDPQGTERQAWLDWLRSPAGTLSPVFRASDGSSEEMQVRSDPFCTADIEYPGNRLRCCGFTRHSDVAIVFTVNSLADLNDIRSVLLCGIPLCFQNGIFDASILEWFHNIACMKFIAHDTMIAMHASYIELQKDLGFIGSIYAEYFYWKDAVDWEKVADGTQPWEEVLYYNSDDVWITHSAMVQLLADELTEPAVWEVYRHEMALVAALWEISKRGVKISSDLGILRKQLEEERITLEAGLFNLYGGPLNVKSQQVMPFLYDKLGIPKVGGKTPSGAWKSDDTTLSELLQASTNNTQRAAVTMVRKTRERRDLISKFCDIELDDDGRMRCHYDPAKTDTGRLSSRKFYPTDRGANLQNVPRDPRVRAIFTADAGFVFGYSDLKSAESLVVAHITGDSEMLRLHSPAYLSGELDGHKYVAAFLFNKPIDRITKDERYIGKRVRHACNYGMSWFKLMRLINAETQETGVSITAAQAKVLIQKYHTLHAMLGVWWKDVEKLLWDTHTLYTHHGRKRVFHDHPSRILLDAIAYDPQGTVGDTTNIGLLRLSPSHYAPHAREMWTEHQHMLYAPFEESCMELQEMGFVISLQVHDALGWQTPEKHLDATVPLVVQAMTVPINISRKGLAPYQIEIPIETQVGLNWGEWDAKKPDINPNGLKKYA